MRDLVLLPGFMLNTDMWRDVLPGMNQLGRVHFGDLGQDQSIAAMAERVLRDAPPRFVLLGFSMGGFVSQAIALSAPERVAGLALLNTSSRPASEVESGVLAQQRVLAERLPFKGLTSRNRAAALHPESAGNIVLLDRLQAMALQNGKEVFLRQLAALVDESAAPPAALENIRCPTLVVGARQDRLRTLEESAAMARRIPHATLAVVEDSGHMTSMEQPQQLLKIITDWIAAAGL